MASQGHKYASSCMSIVGLGIILPKVKFVVILEEMETTYVENAMLEAHVKPKEVLMDFTASLRYESIFIQLIVLYLFRNISSQELLEQ